MKYSTLKTWKIFCQISLKNIIFILSFRKIVVLVTSSLCLLTVINTSASEENNYANLKNSWNEIFPDSNRNAGGANFFKYILEK